MTVRYGRQAPMNRGATIVFAPIRLVPGRIPDTISGISYLLSFRDDFGEEIEQKGLNELISGLEGEYEHVTQSKKGLMGLCSSHAHRRRASSES
jgi:hypothetical protein